MIIFQIFCVFLFLCLFIDFQSAFIQNEERKSPLVIIPGDGGSRAYSTINNKHKVFLWVNYMYMMLFPTHLSNYFKLVYDPLTHTTKDAPNSNVIFPGWGSTETIEDLDVWSHNPTVYFSTLVNELIKDKFYVRNITLRGAPYDFRKTQHENVLFNRNLKIMIEETYKQVGNTRIVLLGHSLGSLYSLHFLNEMCRDWKKKYIRAFISISGPLGGSVKAVEAETIGDSFGSYRNSYLFREMERSFPSTAFLMPNHKIFGDIPIVITPNKNYSANDYDQLFKDMGYDNGALMYNDTKNLINGSLTPEGIDELYCIHGYNINTNKQLVFTNFPNKKPKFVIGDGDSTVNIQSLQLCKKWKNVTYYPINKGEHKNIVREPDVIDIIKKILYKIPNEETLKSGVYTRKNDIMIL